MTRAEFQKVWQAGFVILDGATGSNLQKAGMPAGVCPEAWILENPSVLINLQKEFVQAGTRILYAPTFAANRLKLASYGLEKDLVRINQELVKLSREAAEGKALVAGDMTMTGEMLSPIGDLELEELIDIYKEQAQALYDAGVDLFIVETMMSLQETRAAVLAIREICDLPVMVSMTFEESGRTLYGTSCEAAVNVLQNLGADVVGMNCSTGPEGMLSNLQRMVSCAAVPVLAKPNAGKPQIVDGMTVYPAVPEAFAEAGKKLAEAGARFLGGCCGTTPEHIRQLTEALQNLEPLPVSEVTGCMLASERETIEIQAEDADCILGDQIDPADDEVQEALRDEDMDTILDLAQDQADEEVSVLNLCTALEGVDEKGLMISAIDEVTQMISCALSVETADPEVLEAALRRYAGRALVNVSGLKDEEIRGLLPVAEKYGALLAVREDIGQESPYRLTSLKKGTVLRVIKGSRLTF